MIFYELANSNWLSGGLMLQHQTAFHFIISIS